MGWSSSVGRGTEDQPSCMAKDLDSSTTDAASLQRRDILKAAANPKALNTCFSKTLDPNTEDFLQCSGAKAPKQSQPGSSGGATKQPRPRRMLRVKVLSQFDVHADTLMHVLCLVTTMICVFFFRIC